MGLGATSALLQTISSAVTPVVMISACAALILGINNKHSALSTQIREALGDIRRGDTTPARRLQLLDEVGLFQRRFTFTWLALIALFIAAAVFMLTAMFILLTQHRHVALTAPTLGLFAFGMALMLAALACELADVALARRTLMVELSDVNDRDSRPGG